VAQAHGFFLHLKGIEDRWITASCGACGLKQLETETMSETTTQEAATQQQVPHERLVMREYSEAIGFDGAAILCNGDLMSIQEIISRLKTLEEVREILYDAPELNMGNYGHDEAKQLNDAVIDAWSVIEADA